MVIVFVHGMGLSSACWDAVRAHVPASVDTIAFDLPGHGARAGEAPLEHVDALADDVARRIDAPSFVVVGHSMGGAVAQALLQRHRERVERAVLVSSALRFPAAPMMLNAARSDMTALRRMFKDGLGGDDVVPRSRALFDACSDSVLVADIGVCASFDARTWGAAPSRAPRGVVVLGGERDEITPPKAWRRLAEQWNARLVEVGAHGHMLTEECPAEVAHAVLAG
jgi:pimeloyl-ACP methyl ester carboxylesterase